MFVVLALTVCAGCDGLPLITDDRPLPPAPKVDVEAVEVEAVASSIRDEAEEIVRVAEDGQAYAPQMPQWVHIITGSAAIVDLTARLDASAEAIKQSQAEIEALERACHKVKGDAAKAVGDRDREIAKLKADLKASHTGKLVALSMLGVLVLAAGGFLMVFKAGSLGIGVMVAGGIIVAASTFLATSGWVLAAVVGGLVVLLGAIAGLTLWQKSRGEVQSAQSFARWIKDAFDDDKPDDFREIVAAWRKTWPALDRAMEAVK